MIDYDEHFSKIKRGGGGTDRDFIDISKNSEHVFPKKN
jgi:hypothetical protein